jgi:hypothetical protein
LDDAVLNSDPVLSVQNAPTLTMIVMGEAQGFAALESHLPPRLRRLGLPAQSRIPETGRGRYRGDFRDYYDEETRELIADRYREEIQRFGYTFWLDSDEGGSVS